MQREQARMNRITEHRIEGGGGTSLHVIATGPADARPVVFVHGFSQCSLAWIRQLESDLAQDHRLIAVDLRGHGLSVRPDAGYDDSRLWADDIAAVIRDLHLHEPVLSGWSYGSLVILDYLRHYGETDIGGIQFIGGVSQLGSEQALAALTPEFLALIEGLLADDAAQAMDSLSALAQLCFRALDTADRYRMLGYAASVPPHVRRGLFSRVLDNDDLLRELHKPVLLTHGSHDAVVRPAIVERHRALMPHAQVQLVAGWGHAPFWDDAKEFNHRLRSFAASLDAAVSMAS